MNRFFLILFLTIHFFACDNKTNKEYYSNGVLSSETTIVNDKMNGIAKTYYESGKLKWEGTMKDDNKHGKSVSFYENGNKKIQTNYQDGIEQGERVEYFENGTIKAKGHYVNNMRTGRHFEYYETGQEKSWQDYSENIANGAFKSFYKNGKIEIEAFFENGKVVYFEEYNEGGKSVKQHRDIDISNVPKVINVSESSMAIAVLKGPSENYAIEAFGAVVKDNETIKKMKRLTMSGSETFLDFSELSPGKYKWEIWFDVRGKNGNNRYSCAGEIEVRAL